MTEETTDPRGSNAENGVQVSDSADYRTEAERALSDYVAAQFAHACAAPSPERCVVLRGQFHPCDGNEAALAAAKRFTDAAKRLSDAEVEELLNAFDERESAAHGDEWQVIKSWNPELWDTFDKDAILRVANATTFEPVEPCNEVIADFDFDCPNGFLWTLKRAQEGVFGQRDLDAFMRRRIRRQAIKYWNLCGDETRQKFIDDGVVDDTVVEKMRWLTKWGERPLENWKQKSFREVFESRTGWSFDPGDDPKSFALQHWLMMYDDQKQDFADYGIVDREFVEVMSQLEEWAEEPDDKECTIVDGQSTVIAPDDVLPEDLPYPADEKVGVQPEPTIDRDQRQTRRQVLESWYCLSEAEKQAFVNNGTVDDEFLQAMQRLEEWERKPSNPIGKKIVPQFLIAGVGGETESYSPKSFVLKFWHRTRDKDKQQLADCGFVDDELLDAMNQLENWAARNP